MKKGRYANWYSDLEAYRSPFFEPFLDYRFSASPGCCGWDAFKTIVGHNPNRRFGKLTTDKLMVEALENSGIHVIPLSVCKVTNRPSLMNLVNEDHVVLISQMFRKDEGSWVILHGGKIFHNCKDETEYFHPLEFINRPILSAYIVWKEKWAPKQRKLKIEDWRMWFNNERFR
jgi:hypothetical protein